MTRSVDGADGGVLTDSEIVERFGPTIRRAITAFGLDPGYVVDMVEFQPVRRGGPPVGVYHRSPCPSCGKTSLNLDRHVCKTVSV